MSELLELETEKNRRKYTRRNRTRRIM